MGIAFDLDVSQPEEVKIGCRGVVPATSVTSIGRQVRVYFKRVYFQVGSVLYALTLNAGATPGQPVDRDFSRILSTLHAPRKVL